MEIIICNAGKPLFLLRIINLWHFIFSKQSLKMKKHYRGLLFPVLKRDMHHISFCRGRWVLQIPKFVMLTILPSFSGRRIFQKPMKIWRFLKDRNKYWSHIDCRCFSIFFSKVFQEHFFQVGVYSRLLKPER